METPVYIALSRQTALRREMNTIANNMANANTVGFRGERLLFQEYLARTGEPGRREPMSYVQDVGMYRETTEGPLQQTGNALDMALRGQGYFAVQAPGQEMYTRQGTFHLDAQQRMVTADGYPILLEGDRPLLLPDGVAEVVVTGDGVVRSGQQELGRLKVVSFADDQALRKSGNGLYMTDQTAVPAGDVQVIQGALEGSNIQPILEMTKMLELLKDYQSTQKIVESESERQRTAASRLVKNA